MVFVIILSKGANFYEIINIESHDLINQKMCYFSFIITNKHWTFLFAFIMSHCCHVYQH